MKTGTKTTGRALWVLALALAGIAISASRAPVHAAPPQSYRVLTYNVAMLPHNITGIGSGPATFDAMSVKSRVDAIVKHIFAGDYDIVALDEVWTDTAKEEFIKKLTVPGGYPYYATQMWGHILHKQDAGIMIFSKFMPIANPYVPPVVQTTGFGTIGMDTNRLFDPLGNPLAAPPEGRDFGFYSCIDQKSLDETGPGSGWPPFSTDNWIHIDKVSLPFPFLSCSAAFHLYPNRQDDDAWAEKGIGYIRVRNSKTGRPLNVFFTHNQAIYWDASPSVPFAQHSLEVQAELMANQQAFEEEAAFMNLFVPPLDTRTWNEDTIAIGDHNVPGDTPYYDDIMKYVPKMIAGMAYADARDVFRSDMSPSKEDPGYTWSVGNSTVPPQDLEGNDRLDYVFDRPGKEIPDCALHQRVLRDWLFEASDLTGADSPAAVGLDLSDHYPLEVTLGEKAPLCSPSVAAVNPLPPNVNDLSIGGDIAYASAYQWYRFDGHDTLSFGISGGAPMEVTAWASNDLSMPLKPVTYSAPWGGPPDTTVTFVNGTNAQALYLRVRSFDPDYVGPYTLHLHRNTGSSINDPLELPNGIDGYKGFATFSSGLGGAQPQQKVYFHFWADQLWAGSWAGARQTMQFDVVQLMSPNTPFAKATKGDPSDQYWINIYSGDGQTVLAGSKSWSKAAEYKAKLVAKPVPPEGAGDYYFVVTRKQPYARPEAYIFARWFTDLRSVNLDSVYNIPGQSTDFDNLQAVLFIDDYLLPYVFSLGESKVGQPVSFPEPEVNPQGWVPNPTPIDVHRLNFNNNVTLYLTLPGCSDLDSACASEPVVIPAQPQMPGSMPTVPITWSKLFLGNFIPFSLKYQVLP